MQIKFNIESMAYFIPPHIVVLHQQLECLRKEVCLKIVKDESILNNNRVIIDLNYEKDGEEYMFSDLAIDLDTLLHHNLVEYAFELGNELDSRVDEINDTALEYKVEEKLTVKRVLN